MTTPKTSSNKFHSFLCVYKHGLFICKFTSPCSMFAVCFFLTVFIWFPSAVFQHFSKSDKRSWLARSGVRI